VPLFPQAKEFRAAGVDIHEWTMLLDGVTFQEMDAR